MTPAVKQAKQNKINYQLHQYQHDSNANSFEQEADDKLAINAEQIFKTLVVATESQQLAVAIVPVSQQLNLKAMAKALKVKKVQMAQAKRVETSTGYVLGGVSPLGQKKRLTTIIDNSGQNFESIYISGGKRGLEIELSASDLAMLTKASFAEIAL
ncbi:MAG: Cys-tRNA(Pro) deacylase [Alteromonadaceae bacterium]|nr:Cys-tRNA(Pro) deacylase [Alteromonadaceae bacterium]